MPALISDPYFLGGGLHETTAGDKLGIQDDFGINDQLHLNWRLNTISWLNNNGDDAYGDQFELWDKQMLNKVHNIAPVFNRCVIFTQRQIVTTGTQIL